VNGPHDIGGTHGLGAVVREHDEPVFHAPWERTIFALMLSLAGQGRFNPDEFRFARETIPPGRYLAARYFELWLFAVEWLLERDGVLSAETIDAKTDALRARRDTGPPRRLDPALAERLHRQVSSGHSTAGPAPGPRRFAAGDGVRTRNMHPEGHTRLPWYARDKRGVVEALYPAFPLPDRIAHGGDPQPEHLYCVRFEGSELWGDSAEPGSAVHLDCWESYLQPDPQPTSSEGRR
jgi:nitrile hydratase subunit beta